MSYLARYSLEQARRHQVRPGLTGLAQVSGRNALSWEDKFRLDVHYVDHHTFLGDLKIICGTVVSVANTMAFRPTETPRCRSFLATTAKKQRARDRPTLHHRSRRVRP
jgi:sugar transferase EpsL